MKILQVITSLNTGGAEKLLVDSVPIYQKKGIKMDVLSLQKKDILFKTKLLQQSNGKLYELTNKSVYNPILIFKIIPYLKQYDVVHVHLFPSLYWVALAKWISFSKIKIIYTEHSTNNKRRKYFLFRLIDRIIYRSVNKIITIADQVDINIKKHLGFQDYKFQLINNGVDLKKFIKASALDKDIFFSEHDFIITQVSSFRYPKDQKTVILSLKLLTENIKLLLVGDGSLKKECEELVKTEGLESRVKFLGVREDIPNVLQTSDVVVLSSFHEGLSLSCLEGMATKPFIASNVPGLVEIVENFGLLFEQTNAQDLADKIMSLYKDEDYYQKVKEKCFLRANDFDINNMVDLYINEYKKAIK